MTTVPINVSPGARSALLATLEPASQSLNVSVARDSCVVISSLDLNARRHNVSFKWTPTGLTGHTCGDASLTDRRCCNQPDAENSPPERVRSPRPTLDPIATACRTATSKVVRTVNIPRFNVSMPALQPADHNAQRCTDHVTRANLIAEAPGVRLYAAECDVNPQLASNVVGLVSGSLRPAVEDRLGPVTDIDGDQHLSVVVSRLGCESMSPPVLGCVRPSDFLTEDSTAGDTVYLDFRLLQSTRLEPVLTHELAHASVFSRLREAKSQGDRVRPLPGWLNESIAHACEYELYSDSPNLSSRISRWEDNTGHWPLVSSPRFPIASNGRGPERAVGLFFARFLIERTSMRELVQRAVFDPRAEFLPEDPRFAKTFQDWTVWMATQRDCNISVPLPPHATRTDMVLTGTSARWFTATTAGTLEVNGSTPARLQVTEIDAHDGVRSSNTTSGLKIIR